MFEKNEKKDMQAADMASVPERKKPAWAEMKIRKKERSVTPAQKLGIRAVLIPLILAFIVTGIIFLLVNEQKENRDDVTYGYCAIDKIPAHTLIIPETFDIYFMKVLYQKASLPDEIIRSKEDLPEEGFYTEREVSKHEMLLESSIVTSDLLMEKYETGYFLASVSADTFKNCINGSIRRGDIIELYARNPASNELEEMLTNVYVEKAFDNNGMEVTVEGSSATSFTIRVAKAELDTLNLAFSYGDIHIYESK